MAAHRLIYESSNGDTWSLTLDSNDLPIVIHTPNSSSGGQSLAIDLGSFLKAGLKGPEHQALRSLIATLVESSP